MNSLVLPSDTRLGAVHLRVRNLDRGVAFYTEVLGLQLLAEDGATAALGCVVGTPLVVLHAEAVAPRRPAGTTGLFHFALRVPSRAALGAMVRRVQAAGHFFDGFGDHNVSEAAYLSDPEGNGIELYADRSRDVWYGVEGHLFMTTEPLDVPGLLVAASAPASHIPEGTVVGHIHLRVSSLELAEVFYREHLGFQVTSRSYPGALFLAAGGYHHHVGANVWGGVGAKRPPEGSAGLVYFEMVVPGAGEGAELLETGYLEDPDGVGVRVIRG